MRPRQKRRHSQISISLTTMSWSASSCRSAWFRTCVCIRVYSCLYISLWVCLCLFMCLPTYVLVYASQSASICLPVFFLNDCLLPVYVCVNVNPPYESMVVVALIRERLRLLWSNNWTVSSHRDSTANEAENHGITQFSRIDIHKEEEKRKRERER